MMNQLAVTNRKQIFEDLRLSINQLVGAIRGELDVNQEDAIKNLNFITRKINHLED